MTEYFEFWVRALSQFFQAAIDCKFEFFGFEVSMIELSLAVMLLCACISFLRFSTGDLSILRYRSGRKENVDDKKNENYTPKHTIDYHDSLIFWDDRRTKKNEKIYKKMRKYQDD